MTASSQILKAHFEFTLGTQFFFRLFPRVVTLFPKPKKFAARSALFLESENSFRFETRQ
jgi:hypothetical protein